MTVQSTGYLNRLLMCAEDYLQESFLGEGIVIVLENIENKVSSPQKKLNERDLSLGGHSKESSSKSSSVATRVI